MGVLPSALEEEGPEVLATLIDLLTEDTEEEQDPDEDPSQAAWTGLAQTGD